MWEIINCLIIWKRVQNYLDFNLSPFQSLISLSPSSKQKIRTSTEELNGDLDGRLDATTAKTFGTTTGATSASDWCGSTRGKLKKQMLVITKKKKKFMLPHHLLAVAIWGGIHEFIWKVPLNFNATKHHHQQGYKEYAPPAICWFLQI